MSSPPPFKAVTPIEYTLEEEESVHPRRPQTDNDMDITPMIDITFLLLIFFLVASRMDTSGSVKLPKAHHGTAIGTKTAVVITIAKGDGDQARIYLGDGTESGLLGGDLVEQEQAIVGYIDEGLKAEIPKEHVLVKAGRDVKHRSVARVARAVGQIPDLPLYVAVLEES